MISSSNTILSRSRNDILLMWILRILAGLAGSLLLLVIGFLLHESWPALRQTGLSRFWTDLYWFPTENSFGMTPMILGTLGAAAGSILLASPLAILSALFCQYYAPPALSRWFRRMIELLAGIPSVVFGLWGLVVLVPLIGRWHPPGPSLLAGILILAVMILPTIMLVAQASMAQVPSSYLHTATALGLSRWTMIRYIILPTARSGIVTGVLLGVARALGETMAMLMVCGNVVQIPSHLFDPIRTLTANMALEMGYALGQHRSALFVSGLMLMGLVALCVGLAEHIRHNTTHATTT